MSVKEEHICRLCLKVAKDGFEIDEVMKHMFEILSLKLNLDITRNSIICQDCMEISIKCLNFKYTCINTEEFILSYSADRKEVKFNIKDIYEERDRAETVFDEGFNICRLCMTRMERNNFISLDALMNESMFEMLSEYMAEMDFSIIENPLVCANCKENLESYFKFLLSCQDMEDKIKAYCKGMGTDITCQVNLRIVLLLFIFTGVLKYPGKSSQTYKTEKEHTECLYPEAHTVTRLMKHEEVYIKDEEIIEINLDKIGDTSPPVFESEEHTIESLNTYQKNVKVNIMEDRSFDEGVLELKSDEICDIRINKPVICNTVDLQSYISADGNICPRYKCSFCSYEANKKGILNRHMLVHMDVSEMKMYKCSLCTYKTKKKSHLKLHMLVHKDVSEIKMYKCTLCPYEGKQKSHLTTHMLIHKPISEIKMYKCSLCTFETRYKGNLVGHMLVHKNVKDMKMYKSLLCAYETKHKRSLNKHIKLQRDEISEIKMYKGSFCAYQAKNESSLNVPMVVHKDISEMNVYKCSLCMYPSIQTKRGP